jgi:hypothetical protein
MLYASWIKRIKLSQFASSSIFFASELATEDIYVLVFICYMTKYVELVPLQNIRSTTIADALINHVICRHGITNVLHSDRGTSYLVNIVRETCKTGNGTNFVFVRVCGISL